MLNVVLVRPEIPQNTGSIARLTAATHSMLHLVKPLGFSLEDKYVKRAGLDYWPLVNLRTYEGWEEFGRGNPGARLKFFSARAAKPYTEARYQDGDFLVFGSETKGLGPDFLKEEMGSAYRIPIFEPGVRSLNLANAVSIVLYEAVRQMGELGG